MRRLRLREVVALGGCDGSSCCPVMRDPGLCFHGHLSVKGKCLLPCVFTRWGIPELRDLNIYRPKRGSLDESWLRQVSDSERIQKPLPRAPWQGAGGARSADSSLGFCLLVSESSFSEQMHTPITCGSCYTVSLSESQVMPELLVDYALRCLRDPDWAGGESAKASR